MHICYLQNAISSWFCLLSGLRDWVSFASLLTHVLFFLKKGNDMTAEDREKLDAWLGPVYSPFKPRYQWYFEIVMLLRRVLLASALSMISSSSTLQTFVVWVILVCFAVIHLCLHPYDDSSYKFASENFFEPLVLLVLSMSFILLKFSAVENLMTYSAAYVWVVMIVNSWTLLFLVGIIFYRLATCGNEDKDGNFSGHRHVSARNGRSSDDEERSNLLSVNSARKRYVEVANIS